MFLPFNQPIFHVIIEAKKQPRIKKVNQYLFISKIGSGNFSKVYLALKEGRTPEKKPFKFYYAAKAINVHHEDSSILTIEREIRVLRQLNHPYIISLQTVLYAPSKDIVYIVMELANCGTLQNAINKNIQFDERTIASIFIQISLALSYVHSNGIVHSDVKPSNILLFDDGTAKISDFGISRSYESAESVVGTPAYQSPDLFDEDSESFSSCENSMDLTKLTNKKENSMNAAKLANKKENNFFKDENMVVNEDNMSENNNMVLNYQKAYVPHRERKKIDMKKGDVWSLGISMFQTAFGVLPYSGKNIYEIINKIKTSSLIFPQKEKRKYSPLLIDLIDKMLKKKSNERLSMNEVIQHPFFVRYQINASEKQIEENPCLIRVGNNRAMQKVKFDIQPIQLPDYINSQVVNIDAIVCPENFSFASGVDSASYRLSYI